MVHTGPDEPWVLPGERLKKARLAGQPRDRRRYRLDRRPEQLVILGQVILRWPVPARAGCPRQRAVGRGGQVRVGQQVDIAHRKARAAQHQAAPDAPAALAGQAAAWGVIGQAAAWGVIGQAAAWGVIGQAAAWQGDEVVGHAASFLFMCPAMPLADGLSRKFFRLIVISNCCLSRASSIAASRE